MTSQMDTALASALSFSENRLLEFVWRQREKTGSQLYASPKPGTSGATDGFAVLLILAAHPSSPHSSPPGLFPPLPLCLAYSRASGLLMPLWKAVGWAGPQ